MQAIRHLVQIFRKNSDAKFWLASVAAHLLLLAFIGGVVLRENTPSSTAPKTQFFYITQIQESTPQLKDEAAPLTPEVPDWSAPDTTKIATEKNKPSSQPQDKGVAVTPPLSLPIQSAKVSNKVTFFGLQPAGEKIVFVVDLSGSMLDKEGDQTRIDIAEKEIHRAIGKLGDNQYFNIVLFGDRVAKLSKNPVAPSPENRSRAFKFLEEDHNLGGSTNLTAGLSAAIEMCPDSIVVLTDGEANDADDTILSQVRYLRNKLSPRTQIHAIGFFLREKGHPDRFLARLTSENDGSYLRWSREMQVAALLHSLPSSQ